MQNIDQRQLRQILTLGIVGLGIVCLAFILIGRFGYAKLQVALPDNTNFFLNGKTYGSNETIKVRSGTYTIAIKAPNYSVVTKKLRLSNFQTKSVTEALFTTRQPADIVSSVIGSYGSFGPPSFTSVKWFKNYTWLVGQVGPGSLAPTVLEYTDNQWTAVYYNQVANNLQVSQFPSDVQAYLKQLEAHHD